MVDPNDQDEEDEEDSSSDVSAAEHQARDDATEEGIFERGNDELNRKPFSKDDESGQRATGFWKSIFGGR